MLQTNDLIPLRDRILGILKQRFLSPEGVLYDYAGKSGEVILPTAEECRTNRPNALGWNSPIENGAFFNGDLLPGLIRCYEKCPSESLAADIRRFLHGLFVLQDRSPVPGCILRGVTGDGVSHYPASSNDQVIPFLLGVREYSRSSLATESERSECRRRCLETVNAIRANGWLVPGAKPGFETGMLAHYAPFDVSHIMLAAMIIDDVSPDPDGSLTEKFLAERGDLLAAGYPDIRPDYCWICTHTFYILRMLAERYAASEYGPRFRNALRITAKACLATLPEWKKRIPNAAFSPDWHPLNRTWIEQKNREDALACSAPQWDIWRETSPAVMDERETVMRSLAGAWIILISEDREVIREAMPQILDMLENLPYEDLYYAPFFFAIDVISEL